MRVGLYFIIATTAIEKCDTKSFWHGFTQSNFKILYRTANKLKIRFVIKLW